MLESVNCGGKVGGWHNICYLCMLKTADAAYVAAMACAEADIMYGCQWPVWMSMACAETDGLRGRQWFAQETSVRAEAEAEVPARVFRINGLLILKRNTVMADNKKQQELKIELTPEMATGNYANLAVISHTPGEFFLDFITVTPNMPQARVNSRIIMNPENAKNLLFALRDNIQKYENNYGEIERKLPKNNGDANPFQA